MNLTAHDHHRIARRAAASLLAIAALVSPFTARAADENPQLKVGACGAIVSLAAAKQKGDKEAVTCKVAGHFDQKPRPACQVVTKDKDGKLVSASTKCKTEKEVTKQSDTTCFKFNNKAEVTVGGTVAGGFTITIAGKIELTGEASMKEIEWCDRAGGDNIATKFDYISYRAKLVSDFKIEVTGKATVEMPAGAGKYIFEAGVHCDEKSESYNFEVTEHTCTCG